MIANYRALTNNLLIMKAIIKEDIRGKGNKRNMKHNHAVNAYKHITEAITSVRLVAELANQ